MLLLRTEKGFLAGVDLDRTKIGFSRGKKRKFALLRLILADFYIFPHSFPANCKISKIHSIPHLIQPYSPLSLLPASLTATLPVLHSTRNPLSKAISNVTGLTAVAKGVSA